MPKVREERTGWRDEGLSQRHRNWGYDCPAVDIDFLLIEYDNSMPVALVEYKNEQAQCPNFQNASYQAIINLGDMANIPVFSVRYSSDFSWWEVYPLNSLAADNGYGMFELTEKQYVSFLYRLRGRAR